MEIVGLVMFNTMLVIVFTMELDFTRLFILNICFSYTFNPERRFMLKRTKNHSNITILVWSIKFSQNIHFNLRMFILLIGLVNSSLGCYWPRMQFKNHIFVKSVNFNLIYRTALLLALSSFNHSRLITLYIEIKSHSDSANSVNLSIKVIYTIIYYTMTWFNKKLYLSVGLKSAQERWTWKYWQIQNWHGDIFL